MSSVPDRLSAALAGRYRIEHELGAGGMATVYLAHDLRHDRDVAIKVLHPDLGAALGGERFISEIRTTARLQHPHILPLLDSGEADGLLFYAMPLVEGETLRARLERERQLPVAEALRIAREVASALDYAHRQQVIHRDIKPENILLHDGQAIVADFGIALAVQSAGGARMTQTGLSLGTPQYMSPEQAMGERSIDARSDIYSLGAVLYEMLAGDAPFAGSSVQAIVAKVLNEKPTSLRTLRDTVPMHVEQAVFTALAKLPADRFESAKAFGAALEDARSAGAMTGFVASDERPRADSWWRQPTSIGAMVVIALLGAGLVFVGSGRPSASGRSSRQPTRVSVVIPDDSVILSVNLRTAEVAPDGRAVLFSGMTTDGSSVLLRPLDRYETITLASGGAISPFFAPDGQQVGYFRGSELWSTSIADREATRLAVIPRPDYSITRGMWHPDGRVFVSTTLGLFVVPAGGGVPELLEGERDGAPCRSPAPRVLESGQLLINCLGSVDPHVELMDADGTSRRRVLPGVSFAVVVDDIALVLRQDIIQASRIRLRDLSLVGPVITLTAPITPRFSRSLVWGEAGLDVDDQLVFRGADGRLTPLSMGSGALRWPRLSPDGRRLAVGSYSALVLFDLARGVSSPLHGATEPTWAPDGRSIIMSQQLEKMPGLLLVRDFVDGSNRVDTLLTVKPPSNVWPTDVSPDGRWVSYYGITTHGAAPSAIDVSDIGFLELDTRTELPMPIPGFQRGARFSPNGRWVAYTSSESGPNEVWVCAWPSLERRTRVSVDGGDEPAWSRAGDTLFFRSRDDIMATVVSDLNGAIATKRPVRHFAGGLLRDINGDQSYDIAPDGRFLLRRVPPRDGKPLTINLELDWIEEVRARLDRAKD